MLKVYFGNDKQSLLKLPAYFDYSFVDSWIDNPLSKEIIKGVDKSDVLYAHVIESPILGPITPRELSGGAKSLILLAFDPTLKNTWIDGVNFGDNTVPYLLKVADQLDYDILLELGFLLQFPTGIEFTVEILNSHRIVHNEAEYMEEYFKFG